MGDEISGNRKKVNRTHLLVIPSAILIAFSVGSLQAQESTEATSSLLDKFRDVSSGFYDKTKEALDDVFESDYTQLTQKSIVGLNNPEIKEKMASWLIGEEANISTEEVVEPDDAEEVPDPPAEPMPDEYLYKHNTPGDTPIINHAPRY